MWQISRDSGRTWLIKKEYSKNLDYQIKEEVLFDFTQMKRFQRILRHRIEFIG